MAMVVGNSAAFGCAGFVVPLLFDHDFGGVIAAVLTATLGVIVGGIFGYIVARRNF